MSFLGIRHYGDPILRQKALPQKSFDDSLKKQAEDMIETMQAMDGIGLAANQVGFSNAICVVDIGIIEEGVLPEAFVNPEILEEMGDTVSMDEGCLSIPDITDDVKRKEKIRIRFQNLDGKEYNEEYSGMLARVLMHEVDHLNGIFFIDRLSPMRRKMLDKKLKTLAEQTAGKQ